MSLINQMLQDLDARRETGDSAPLPPSVRPLPPAPPSSRGKWLILAALGVAVLAGYIVWPGEQQTSVIETTLVHPAVQVMAPANDTANPAPPRAAPASIEPVREVVDTTPGAVAEASEEADKLDTPAVQVEESTAMSERPATVATEPEAPVALVKPEAAKKEAAPTRVDETRSAAAKNKPTAKPSEERRAETRKADAQSASSRPGRPQENTVRPMASAASEPAASPARRGAIERSELSSRPDTAEALYRKAMTAIDHGQRDEAKDLLHEALRADALHVAARQQLVKSLLESRRVDEAMEVLRDGLRVRPAQSAWAMSLARLQVDRGDLAGAAQTLQEGLPAAFNNPDYLGFAGHLQQRLGNGKEAATLYQGATRMAPGDGRWWLGLGLAMESEGRNDQAVAAFQRARQCANLSRELNALVEQKLRQLQ